MRVAIFIVLLSMLFLVSCQKAPVACTDDALLCPDGSGVGRIGNDCRFAPCPGCSCPGGYVLEGDTCNPSCYYNNPKCLSPSIKCKQSQIANPASVFCEKEGGSVEIITDADGSQYGNCVINGVVCEEWAYFRGECHICTEEEKAAQACTLEYNPVCSENMTYGNGCAACSAGVDKWMKGECV